MTNGLNISQMLNEDTGVVATVIGMGIEDQENYAELYTASTNLDALHNESINFEVAGNILTAAAGFESLCADEDKGAEYIAGALAASSAILATVGYNAPTLGQESIEADPKGVVSLSAGQKVVSVEALAEKMKQKAKDVWELIKKLFTKAIIALTNNEKIADELVKDLKDVKTVEIDEKMSTTLGKRFGVAAALNGGSTTIKDVASGMMDLSKQTFIPEIKGTELSLDPRGSFVKWYKASDLKKFENVDDKASYLPLNCTGKVMHAIAKKVEDGKTVFTVASLSIKKDDFSKLEIKAITVADMIKALEATNPVTKSIKDYYKTAEKAVETFITSTENIKAKENASDDEKAKMEDLKKSAAAFGRSLPAVINKYVMGSLNVSKDIIVTGKDVKENGKK